MNQQFHCPVNKGDCTSHQEISVSYVKATGTSLALFNEGYGHLFAVLSTSEQYLASAVALAAEKAEETGMASSDVKVAVAVENDPFSLDIRAGVLEDASKYGMQIIQQSKCIACRNEFKISAY